MNDSDEHVLSASSSIMVIIARFCGPREVLVDGSVRSI